MRSLPAILEGVKIFPCIAGTKDPATEHGWKDASNDPAQIAEWQRVLGDCNWAVACGLSGIFVFDIDPAGLDWWAKLLERDPKIKAAVDAAFQVRTPKGGLHVYFAGEGPSTASRIADGIDTRGGIMRNGELVSGGYVILPGSHTVAGPGRVDGAYTALPGGIIAELPGFLSSIVPERKKTDTLGLEKNPKHDNPRNIQTAKDLLNKYVADGRVAIQGRGGDNLTFQVVASILDKGISPGVAFDLLWEMWNPHCSPPWDDWELETKIRNALAHGEDTRDGVKGFQANEDAFAHFVGMETPANDTPPKRKRFEVLSLKEARRDVRPAKWLIPGFVPDTGAGILYGMSGSYKTFLALDWALCLAFGVPGQWQAPPVKHCVLFLAGESSYALRQERVDSWCEKHGLDPDDCDFHMVAGVPMYSDTEAWEEIREELKAKNLRPSFIVIDTLTRMMTGMDENSSNDGKLILRHCEEMATHYGAFVLGVGHTGKDQAKGLRGTQVLVDNSEAVHSMKKTQNGTSLKVLKLKEVDIPPEAFYFDVEKFGKSIVLTRTDKAPAMEANGKPRSDWASMKEVLRVLSDLGGRTTNSLLVQTIAENTGVDREKVAKTLRNNPDLNPIKQDGGIWEIPKQEHDL